MTQEDGSDTVNLDYIMLCYPPINAICRPPHWCLWADGPSGLGLVTVPFLNQVATPLKATNFHLKDGNCFNYLYYS